MKKELRLGLTLLALCTSQLVWAAPEPTQKDETGMMPTHLPIQVKADKIKYVGVSGDVFAKGKVDVYQGSQYIGTELVEGNTKQAQYMMPGKVILKDTGMNFIGQHMTYNGNTRIGTLDTVEGLTDNLYIRGEGVILHTEPEAQKAILEKGMVTTEHAMAWKVLPDYRIDGEAIEVIPQDKVIIHEAKFYIKKWHILTLKKLTSSLNTRSHNASPFALIPKPTYDEDNGFGLRGGISYPLGSHGEAFANYNYYTKVGFKPAIGLAYHYPWGDVALAYSKDTSTINNRNVWVIKKPELRVNYKGMEIGHTGIRVSGEASYGYWEQGHVKGAHNKLLVRLAAKPVPIIGNKLKLFINGGYQRDYYGYNHVTRTMPFIQTRLGASLSPKLSMNVGYNVFNYKGKTPYTFDTVDNRHYIDGSIFYQVTRLDRLGYYVKYDTDIHKITDKTITYIRDMHSMVGTFSYNLVDKKYKFKIAFKDFDFGIG